PANCRRTAARPDAPRLAEGVFDLAENALVAVGDGSSEALGQSLKEFPLLVGKVRRSNSRGADQAIATAARVKPRDALAPHVEHVAGLSARWDTQRRVVPVERRYPYFEAQRRLRRIHLQLVDQIILFPREERMREHTYVDIEVAGAAAVRADIAFAVEAHARAVADAGGDLDA